MSDALPATPDTNALAELDQGKRALTLASTPDESLHVARYASAVVDYLRRAHQANPRINEALLLQVEALVQAADQYEAGVEAGEFARKEDGRPKKVSETRTLIQADLCIDRRRISEGKKLRADNAAEYIRNNLEESIALAALLAGKGSAELLVQSDENEWYTPEPYIEAARRVLGQIDLDPASSDEANKTVRATAIHTKHDGGLGHDWHGRLWLNPPYGRLAGDFTRKLISEHQAGNVTAAILLVNAHCTDTDWFQGLWNHILCFTDHRIDFDSAGRDKHTTSTHGSVFAYLGDDPTRFAHEYQQFGAVVKRWT